MIHNGEHTIIASALRETSDQVHCNLGERWGIGWDGYLVERGVCLMGEVFVLLADHTSLHILFDLLSHARP